jgi:NADH dehydrogenase FAD-containing subunit
LIADGSIELRSGVSVEALGEHTVLLSDGSELPADVVVYATGYDRGPAAKVPDGFKPAELAQIRGRTHLVNSDQNGSHHGS